MVLINDGAVDNLMSYSIFKKLGREDDELVKTNLTWNGMGGQPDGGHRCRLHGAYRREQVARYHILLHRGIR
jgi:hypothetical protein